MPEREIEYVVPDGVSGRADKVLATAFPDLSRARIQRAFEAGDVRLAGEVVGKKARVGPGAQLAVRLAEPEASDGPRPREIALNIVYEDAALVVVDKAPGMTVHPGSGTAEDTLVHALLHHCGGSLSTVGAPDRPGIVHRLDKETSGLIVVARTDAAHHRLAAAFSGREVVKRYQALACGVPQLRSGSCTEPVGRHPVARTRMAVTAGGRPARTDWRLVEGFGDRACHLSCRIHTGRTHQIRVHLSAAGHPLLGDPTYGYKARRLPGVDVPRVMLHAAELRLPHPETGEELALEAPLPGDFVALIERLRGTAAAR